MNCPTCHHTEHHVMRSKARGNVIRRVRQCDRCGHRWATLEIEERVVAKERATLVQARELAARLIT
jgi:transcriptional repressor NrdR